MNRFLRMVGLAIVFALFGCGGEETEGAEGAESAPAAEAASGESEGSANAGSWSTEGTVVFIAEDQSYVEIDHEEVDGYMPAMKMPFHADDPAILEGIAVGDRVEFQFTRPEGARHVLSSIKKR